MYNTKVSIIVPIYNVEQYLEQCLESICAQTLKDIEIICINDGSTDGSLKILESYAKKDKRIKIIDNKNNGYGYSINVGIRLATSKYIGIVESDDFIESNMYEELYALITDNNCDLVKSDFYNYWEKPKKILKHARMRAQTDKIINAKEDINLLKIGPSIWSAIYKKEFLEQNDIKMLETKGASYQDASFHYKTMMCAKKVFLTNKAYLYYRQDNRNSSTKNKGITYCICDEYNELHRFIDARPELECFRQSIYVAEFRAYEWNLKRIDCKSKNEFFKYYFSVFRKYYDNGYLQEYFFTCLKEKYDFSLFIDAPEKFYKKFLKAEKKAKWRKIRKQIISIKINPQRVSIEIFGKQILRID